MNDKVYNSLIHHLSKALFLGIGISKILIESKENFIFSIILGSLFGCFILYFINNIKFIKYKGLKKGIIFLIIYILLIIGLANFVSIISNIFLMNTNKYIILLPLLLVIIYFNSKDIVIHLKISKILLYLSFLLLFIYVLLVPKINYLNYLPLFNVSFKKILFSSFEFSLYSVVPSILYGGINYNVSNKKILKEYLFSNSIIFIILLVIMGILGSDLVSIFKYPEYVVLKRIRILSFIENIENIVYIIWLFYLILYISICSKELYDISNSIFNNKLVYPLFLIISVLLITKYFFNNILFYMWLNKYLWIILLIILLTYIFLTIKLKPEK